MVHEFSHFPNNTATPALCPLPSRSPVGDSFLFLRLLTDSRGHKQTLIQVTCCPHNPHGSHLPSRSQRVTLPIFWWEQRSQNKMPSTRPPSCLHLYPHFLPLLREEAVYLWPKVCPSVCPLEARPCHLCGNFLLSYSLAPPFYFPSLQATSP